MVVVLIVLTFAFFLLLEWYLVSARQRRGEVDLPPADWDAPLLFHPGHSWVQLSPDGAATVGVSEFSAHFAGRLARIELPRPGSKLRQGQPAWTLISRKDRRLDQVMPVDGTVLAVNKQVLDDPGLVQRSPYGDGWLLQVRPRRLRNSLRNLLHGWLADLWQDRTRASFSSLLNPALGARALDGGEWVPAFGDLLDDDEWRAICRKLFPTPAPLPEDPGGSSTGRHARPWRN